MQGLWVLSLVRGAEIPHALQSKKQSKKWSNIVTNSIKTLKMVHIKKIIIINTKPLWNGPIWGWLQFILQLFSDFLSFMQYSHLSRPPRPSTGLDPIATESAKPYHPPSRCHVISLLTHRNKVCWEMLLTFSTHVCARTHTLIFMISFLSPLGHVPGRMETQEDCGSGVPPLPPFLREVLTWE